MQRTATIIILGALITAAGLGTVIGRMAGGQTSGATRTPTTGSGITSPRLVSPSPDVTPRSGATAVPSPIAAASPVSSPDPLASPVAQDSISSPSAATPMQAGTASSPVATTPTATVAREATPASLFASPRANATRGIRTDLTPTVVAAPRTVTVWTGVPGAPFAASGGMVILEAEFAQTAVSGQGYSWTLSTAFADHAGQGAVIALPDQDLVVTADHVAASPELRFDVYFDEPGIYSIWIRGQAPDGDGNSVFVGLGAAEGAPVEVEGFARGSWAWRNQGRNGTIARLDIVDAGVASISLWLREDGIVVDRLILTKNETYKPNGKGPRLSSQIEQPESPDGGTPTAASSTSRVAIGDGTTIEDEPAERLILSSVPSGRAQASAPDDETE